MRHVRKTIAFDGTAGNGAVGTVAVFTTTGRVHIERMSLFATEALVDAGGGTPATLDFGVTGSTGLFTDNSPLAQADGFILNSWWMLGAYPPQTAGSWANTSTFDISANVILTVANEAINNGTLVIDIWYYPITDDGALAGDDIDLELGAYLADKVLDEALSGHTTAGSLGKAVADVEVDTSTTLQAELDGIQADTEDIQSRLPAALVGGRIDATVDGTGMEAGAVDAILDEVVEGAYTFRQYLRLFASALGAKLAGAATTTVTIQDVGDTKPRITATVDADGNRSAVTLDLT